MRILEYAGLDTSRVAAKYRKVRDFIAAGDFAAADVRKLAGAGHGKLYRARLDDSNRLLFSLIRHGDEVCALMLEVILNHAYDKSRFLRGAEVDEARILPVTLAQAGAEAAPVRYVHPQRADVHVLDKPLSFDDAQDAVYRHPAPLIVVGSAGSGKTALTLEKLKHAEGEVLYVTLSAYLAQNARDLYYAQGFEHAGQDATFLSYREFLESIRVPAGREAQWRDFSAWFARQRTQFRDLDPHQAFEEIRGVIAAQATGILSADAYRALGVKQSIFPAERRDLLYTLFGKYRQWLAESGLYDLNLLAHERLAEAGGRYDFVVVDEVQDLTLVQLALVLKTLRKPGHFLLCGDSNQIVHPNFFSWSQVKTLFWRDEALAARQELAVLSANYRNGQRATAVGNRLLKIKQRRFGSIDRESNFLVDAAGGAVGQVALLPDREAGLRELDQKIRRSTEFAVLVMRDEDKAAARQRFGTPLLFSVHEAKGLEYPNIVLYRFVSDHRAEFAEIAAGVEAADLDRESLDYRRGRDKSDKSLETLKFYVNALYVALTRAIENLYLVESDAAHPLIGLLGLSSGPVQVEATAASLDAWQKEARKLELQGKTEQAAAIRSGILREKPVPWPVFGEQLFRDTLAKVFREQAPGGKPKQQIVDYIALHDQPMLGQWLLQEARFDAVRDFDRQQAALGRKHLQPYYARNLKDVLRQCEQHGLEHRTPMNLTPLMAAAYAGNVALVEALLERGADPGNTDDYGLNALHWALRQAAADPQFARQSFAPIYERIAPASVDLQAGERLVRIDRHLSEYLLVQTLWALFASRFTRRQRRPYCAFEVDVVLAAWQHLPPQVVRPERNKRQAISAVLSRNEVDRDYAYNRALFKRVYTGFYQLNPQLKVRSGRGEQADWVAVYRALNLPLIHEGALPMYWERVRDFCRLGGLPIPATPVAAEAGVARAQAEQAAIMARQAEEARRAAVAARQAPPRPAWGTRSARNQAIAELRRQIAEKNKKG